MQTNQDTNAVIEIRSSPGKLSFYLLLVALCVGAGLYVIAIALDETAEDRAFGLGLGLLCLGFAGVAAISIARRLIQKDQVLVTLGPDGLHDTRVSERPIPWSGVEATSTWSSRGNAFIIVKVAPEVEASIGLSTISRWTRIPNKVLGADGLCINPLGLDVSFKDFRSLIDAYADAHSHRH
ncbi:hypothetical protein E1180_10760 [Roseibium denhamense]|uniref:PH domain-containing protein n=1 Tax=Roseibium denhamense TaxID=76305 RepID=A0ABY1N782_9HYPH|nr:STM3941 family protein [Roseibium denhamense]MTI05992.1 hypothetical protein [Roseibium denhamense]SMP02299.1 hypothetical protein SAMN06265374_0443 [Roseibium denhamense]